MEQGLFEDAEKKLEEAVRLNKKDSDTRLYYAESLWGTGKKEEALEQLYLASQERAGDPRVASSIAGKLVELGQYEAAIPWADQAVRYAPKDWRHRLIRAQAYFHLARADATVGRISEKRRHQLLARNELYQALSLSPNNREVLPDLAKLQLFMNDAEQALATWQNLQGLLPPGVESTEILVGKAESLCLLGRFAEAADCYGNASAREPENLSLYLRRAEMEIAANRLQQAEATLRHMALLAPNNPECIALARRLQWANGKQRGHGGDVPSAFFR